MTTLREPDIAATSANVTRYQPPVGGVLEHFSRQSRAPEAVDHWMSWLRGLLADPESVEDDLVTAPSAQAVLLAIDLLANMVHIGEPPDIVTLGPNGEIVFERRLGDMAVQIVIFDDLRVDRIEYRNGRLTDRQVIIEAGSAFAS